MLICGMINHGQSASVWYSMMLMGLALSGYWKQTLLCNNMSTKYKTLFIILQCFFGEANSFVNKYSHTIGGLSSFPHDIQTNVEEIYIMDSVIHVTDYIEPFPNLASFAFINNRLTQFPDFANVTSSLQELVLNDNDMFTISSMATLPNLSLLMLNDNSLTSFPNLSGVGLQTLNVQSNSLAAIDHIPPMLALSVIYADHNFLSQFPNLVNVTSTLQKLYLTDNVISSINFPQMYALKKLKISKNNLAEFPDITNISSCAEELYFSSNLITSVHLPQMTKLQRLLLSRNRIAHSRILPTSQQH
jgi:Leucine-rich repeat (LRR) protein